ncbi:MAG: ABC transporter ATP-binding protein [Actinomycetota bacterium]|nr:ABC transporter ATP-binding protein [Actinomycetota bacterium]
MLADLSWSVRSAERWVILGPNGAGKTTLLQVAAAGLFPTTGSVHLLGTELGAVDLAELKPRIGWASSAILTNLPAGESVENVVLTGAYGVTGRWREKYEIIDEFRVKQLLKSWGLEALSNRTFGTLSEGERKRTLIARALMSDPELLLLDEPAAGLDLGGREDLMQRLALLAYDRNAPAQLLVTHHVEEIPPGFTHALLLRQGRIVAQGPIEQTLTSTALSQTFDMTLTLEQSGGRYMAQRAR